MINDHGTYCPQILLTFQHIYHCSSAARHLQGWKQPSPPPQVCLMRADATPASLPWCVFEIHQIKASLPWLKFIKSSPAISSYISLFRTWREASHLLLASFTLVKSKLSLWRETKIKVRRNNKPTVNVQDVEFSVSYLASAYLLAISSPAAAAVQENKQFHLSMTTFRGNF